MTVYPGQTIIRVALTAPPIKRSWISAALLVVPFAIFVNAAIAQDVQTLGWRIMTDRNGGNCIACHALPGQIGVISSFGPSLEKVGAQYDETTLRTWVTDARQIKPGTLMPPFGTLRGTQLANSTQPLLTSEQIDQVVAALRTLR